MEERKEIEINNSQGFQRHQLCKRQSFCQIVNIYFFYKIFFFRLKPKQYKNANCLKLFKKNFWKLIKNKVNFYNQ